MVGSGYVFKVIVLGDVGVGKTALEEYMGNIRSNPLDKTQRSTIGVHFNTLTFFIKDMKIRLFIWVISAAKKFRFFLPRWVLNSYGAILLYDITNASSLNRLSEWIPVLTGQCGSIPIVLVGNKQDLAIKRMVSKSQGMEFQKKHQLSSFIEISTKTGVGVAKMFERIRDLIIAPFVKKK
ncbi:MAG: Rab family GTPase [Promethearchaeota archaeon]